MGCKEDVGAYSIQVVAVFRESILHNEVERCHARMGQFYSAAEVVEFFQSGDRAADITTEM